MNDPIARESRDSTSFILRHPAGEGAPQGPKMCRTRSEYRIEGSDGLSFGHSREISVQYFGQFGMNGVGIGMPSDNFSKSIHQESARRSVFRGILRH
jgi:hypothetical protein